MMKLVVLVPQLSYLLEYNSPLFGTLSYDVLVCMVQYAKTYMCLNSCMRIIYNLYSTCAKPLPPEGLVSSTQTFPPEKNANSVALIETELIKQYLGSRSWFDETILF